MRSENGHAPCPPRPKPAGPASPEAVPADLRAVDQWVTWRYEWVNGRWTKVPSNARTGANASSTDSRDSSSFDAAYAAFRRGGYDGVGFVFAADGEHAGIDLDDCRNPDGTLDIEALQIVMALNSYTEVSPSGEGVKIYVRGRKPAGSGCRQKNVPWQGEIEIYDKARFFCVTGEHFMGTPTAVMQRQTELSALCERFWPPQALARPAALPHAVKMSDQQLLDRMFASARGGKIKRLWNGDTSDHGGDDSAADMALCCHLAYWCERDKGRMDAMFRASGLYRKKWERPTYRDPTLDKAIASCTETYEPRFALEREVRGGADASPGPSPAEVQVGAVAQSPRPLALTDLGNAERLVARYGDRLRYVHASGRWHVWDGRRWSEDSDGAPWRLAGEATRLFLRDALGLADPDLRDRAVKFALRSESRARIEAAVKLSECQPAVVVRPQDLDTDRWLFNTLSGTIDLRTGELGPHRRNDLITKLAPVEYHPDAECPLFDTFLGRIFAGKEDMIEYVMRLLGMALTGDASVQILPIFHGSGANGKSVLIDTVKYIMGEYAGDAAPTLIVSTARSEHPTEVADLFNKRLVVASESEQGAELKLQQIKRLTGDATLKGRFMRGDFFEFERTHKLIMVTNNKPRVREDSEAAWRRLTLVPFEVVIPRKERDERLLDKLKEEAPGILARLVRGCLEWRRSGLDSPAAVSLATVAYRKEEDALGQFFEECCVIEARQPTDAAKVFVAWAELFGAYQRWCMANHSAALTGPEFGEALDKRGIHTCQHRIGGKSVKARAGIGLKSLFEQE